MNDAFGKVVAILIACILMFIAPVMLYVEISNNTKNTYVFTIVSELGNEIENTGVISKDRFDMFCSVISNLKSNYHIEITHMKSKYDNNEGEYICSYISDDEIKEKLLSDGKYILEMGDFIKLEVKEDEKSVCFYGGGIKNEDY